MQDPEDDMADLLACNSSIIADAIGMLSSGQTYPTDDASLFSAGSLPFYSHATPSGPWASYDCSHSSAGHTSLSDSPTVSPHAIIASVPTSTVPARSLAKDALFPDPTTAINPLQLVLGNRAPTPDVETFIQPVHYSLPASSPPPEGAPTDEAIWLAQTGLRPRERLAPASYAEAGPSRKRPRHTRDDSDYEDDAAIGKKKHKHCRAATRGRRKVVQHVSLPLVDDWVPPSSPRFSVGDDYGRGPLATPDTVSGNGPFASMLSDPRLVSSVPSGHPIPSDFPENLFSEQHGSEDGSSDDECNPDTSFVRDASLSPPVVPSSRKRTYDDASEDEMSREVGPSSKKVKLGRPRSRRNAGAKTRSRKPPKAQMSASQMQRDSSPKLIEAFSGEIRMRMLPRDLWSLRRDASALQHHGVRRQARNAVRP
ncbi:hypothetical protein AURDEDRAFT_128722 [Auricularia subglabra TFB-10046 SS5]|nr:hypothetical protein AURDEDRAFT_128722 [Auricularia subglabra TFB-10046 SS5]